MTEDKCLVACLVCGTELRNFEPDGGNHPLGGLEFTSPGHYGSRLFDMETGSLVVNICDACLEKAAEAGRVLRHTPAPRVRPDPGTYETWKAS